MEELIAKLENATKGSRELDAAVACRIYKAIGATAVKSGDKLYIEMGPDEYGSMECPYYTTFLDDAIALIPDGWRLDELKNRIDYWGCVLWHIEPPLVVYCGYNDLLRPKHYVTAVCIAAILARQTTFPN